MADLAKILQKTGVKMLPQGSHPQNLHFRSA